MRNPDSRIIGKVMAFLPLFPRGQPGSTFAWRDGFLKVLENLARWR
jgi:hypothetical protein